MCMNCGCGQPHEDHGKPENITLADLQKAGAANDQSLRESAQHILETAQLVVDEPASDRGLAQPAGPGGATTAGSNGGRGTPASES
jgi:hypothetical protein